MNLPDVAAFGDLGIVRVDHVSVAAPDAKAAASFFAALFGMTHAGDIDAPEAGYRGVVLDAAGGQRFQWELLEPASDDSFIAKFLERHGPGVHHVTFEVRDTDAAAAALRKRGIEPFGGVRISGDWKETFIHPRDANGVLIQLFQLVEPE